MEHVPQDDGGVLGEIVEQGDGWVALDRLGRPLTGPTDLAEARAALEEHARGRSADPGEDLGAPPARVVEVGSDRVRVTLEDHGADDAPRRERDLPNQEAGALRPR